MKLKSLSLAVALVAGLAFAAVEPVKIVWKPKASETIKHTLNVKSSTPQGDLSFSAKMSSKVKEIKADGNIVLEETQSDFTIKFGDQDFSGQGPQSVTTTSTMKPNGELVSREGGSDMSNPRLESSFEFIYPDKALEVNESYTIKKPADSGKGLYARETTYTYLGKETIGKWECHKIGFKFKETDAPTNMTCDGTVWLSVADGQMVKANYSMKNVEFMPGMPPADSTAEVMRVE